MSRTPVTTRKPATAVERVSSGPHALRLGRLADVPTQIPWAGWRAVLRRTLAEMISDRISLVSAGCAFYATLALFPAISMLVFVYGLAFDPVTVEPQLAVLAQLLPPEGFALISARVHQLVAQKPGSLTIGLVISTAVTLWSSATGTKSIISALNMAYEERERRSFLRFQMVAFAMTICALLGAVLAIVLLVLLPAAIAFVGVTSHQTVLLRWASVTLLILFVMLALSLLYRFGPSRRVARWTWITPGSLLATVLWVVVSAVLSYYVGHLANYDVTYGPLGAIVGVMLWFWVTVYVVLLGAELNAELELQTARDTTAPNGEPPRPIGQRGAFVADNVAED